MKTPPGPKLTEIDARITEMTARLDLRNGNGVAADVLGLNSQSVVIRVGDSRYRGRPPYANEPDTRHHRHFRTRDPPAVILAAVAAA